MNRFRPPFPCRAVPWSAPWSVRCAVFSAVFAGIVVPLFAHDKVELNKAGLSRAELNQSGIERFQAGEYREAAEIFAQGLAPANDDPLFAYNLGCALVASEDYGAAVNPLRIAANGNDRGFAERARMLLAEIEVRSAQKLLAAKPEETPPENRSRIVEHLDTASSWYESVRVNTPEDESVRGNLERLRLWKSRIQRAWRAFDRSRLLDSAPIGLLERLGKTQRELREAIRGTDRDDVSPRQFQSYYLFSQKQQEISEDIASLAGKFREAGTIPSLLARSSSLQLAGREKRGTPSVPGETLFPPRVLGPDERQELDGMFDAVVRETHDAAAALRRFRPSQALSEQTLAIEQFDRVCGELFPYESLLRDLHRRQEERLSSTSTPFPAPLSNDTESAASETDLTELPAEHAWEQSLIARRIPQLIEKATQGIELIGRIGESETNLPDPSFLREKNKGEFPVEDETIDPGNRRMKRLRESMDLALRHGGELKMVLADAVASLAAEQPDSALPSQRRAFELLEIILEPLREEQPQSGDNEGGEQGEGANEHRERGDSGSPSDQNSPGESPSNPEEDAAREDRHASSAGKGDDQDDTGEKNGAGGGRDRSPSQPSSSQPSSAAENEGRQAEGMLRRVRQRQQEAEAVREKIRTFQRETYPVEKDW